MTYLLFCIETINETYAESISWTHCATFADAWVVLVKNSKVVLTNGDRQTLMKNNALNKIGEQNWRLVQVMEDCNFALLDLIAAPDKMDYYVWTPDSSIVPLFFKSRAQAFAEVTKLVSVSASDANDIVKGEFPVTLRKGNRVVILASLAVCVSY